MIDTLSHSAGLLLRAMDWIQWILVALILLGIPELCRHRYNRKFWFWLILFLIPLAGRTLIHHAGSGRYFQVLFVLLLPMAVLGIEWVVRLTCHSLKFLQKPRRRLWLFLFPVAVFCGIFIGRSQTIGRSKPYIEKFADLVKEDAATGQKLILGPDSIASRIGYYAGCEWLKFRDQVETDRVPLVMQEILEQPEEKTLYWVSEYAPEQLRAAHPMYASLSELGRYRNRAYLYRYNLPPELREPDRWLPVKEFTPKDFEVRATESPLREWDDFNVTVRSEWVSRKNFPVAEGEIYRLRVSYSIKNGTSTAYFGFTPLDETGRMLPQESDTPMIGVNAALTAPVAAGESCITVSPNPAKQFSPRTALTFPGAENQEITGLIQQMRAVPGGVELTLSSPLKNSYAVGQPVAFHWVQFGHLLLPEEQHKGRHEISGIASAHAGVILPQLPRGTHRIRILALLNWNGEPADEIHIEQMILERFASKP